MKNFYDRNGVSQPFPLATEHLSTYTQKGLAAAASIPVGYVASYGSIAKAAGGTPRAAGHVVALNPFAPIVPCHRVVILDFTLGGYGGGLDVKLELLTREKRGPMALREVAYGNWTLRVFPFESVFQKLTGS